MFILRNLAACLLPSIYMDSCAGALVTLCRARLSIGPWQKQRALPRLRIHASLRDFARSPRTGNRIEHLVSAHRRSARILLNPVGTVW